MADLARDLGTGPKVAMRRSWAAMVGFIAVLLFMAVGHRWSVSASWFTSDKTCRERHAAPSLVQRLDIDCGRLLRERLWKLYDEGRFGRSRSGQGAVDYMKHLHGKGIPEQMRQTHPERYAELAGKLIMSAEPLAKNEFASANSMEEMGIRLLEAIGISREVITPNMIEQAIAAQSQFNERLEQIAEASGYKQDWN